MDMHEKTPAPPGALWDFSLALYARDGVADACLRLQDRHGLDVCLILFCVWHGLRLGAVPDAVMARAAAFSERWGREVVRPLRGVRRRMKRMDPAGAPLDRLREEVKAVELAAERIQLERLERLAGAGAAPSAARALENLSRLAAAPPDPDASARFALIVREARAMGPP